MTADLTDRDGEPGWLDGQLDTRPAGTDSGEPRPSTFIHDFVPLGAAFGPAAARVLVALNPWSLPRVIADAYNVERSAAAIELGAGRVVPDEVTVVVGRPRWRADAVVVPVAVRAAPRSGLPIELEADVEVASFGSDRCHLHLLGRAKLPAGTVPMSAEASIFGRLVVAVVRHALDALAPRLVD
ncbi:MAG: hypothetical protein AAF567_03750 [Actinomycetota bacterium]